MRFASHRSLVCCSVYCAWFLSLLLLGCGVNETTTPDEARYYPLPTDYHIQDEYFIVAHPDSKHPALGDAMEIVRRAIFEIYNPKLNSNSDPALSVDQPSLAVVGPLIRVVIETMCQKHTVCDFLIRQKISRLC